MFYIEHQEGMDSQWSGIKVSSYINKLHFALRKIAIYIYFIFKETIKALSIKRNLCCVKAHVIITFQCAVFYYGNILSY